jgi:hypothetical protein
VVCRAWGRSRHRGFESSRTPDMENSACVRSIRLGLLLETLLKMINVKLSVKIVFYC